MDLASPSSIDRFAAEFLNSNRALDLLINNAGICATPLMRDDRGYEMQFATNHFGHFQLTARLWEALKKSRNARVVALSSCGHSMGEVDFSDPNFDKGPYDKLAAYGQSKSANSLFAVELDKRGQEHGIRAFAVHPGGILTDLIRYMTEEELNAFGIYRENGAAKVPELKTIEQGAATTVWCAVSPQLNDRGGVYCEDCDIALMVSADSKLHSGVRPWAVDKAAAEALWILSEKLTPIHLAGSERSHHIPRHVHEEEKRLKRQGEGEIELTNFGEWSQVFASVERAAWPELNRLLSILRNLALTFSRE